MEIWGKQRSWFCTRNMIDWGFISDISDRLRINVPTIQEFLQTDHSKTITLIENTQQGTQETSKRSTVIATNHLLISYVLDIVSGIL